MAQQGNNWNSFMQSKPVRIFLYGLCTVCCLYYTVGAVFDLISPGESALMLIQSMGNLGFTVMTVVRMLVCAWAAVAFARLTVTTIKEDDNA